MCQERPPQLSCALVPSTGASRSVLPPEQEQHHPLHPHPPRDAGNHPHSTRTQRPPHGRMSHSQTPLCCPQRGQGDSVGLSPVAGTDSGAEEPSPSPSWAAGDALILSLPPRVWSQGAPGATKLWERLLPGARPDARRTKCPPPRPRMPPSPTYPYLRRHRALDQLEVLAHVEAVAVEAHLEDAHLLPVRLQRPHAQRGLQRPAQAAEGAAPRAAQGLGDGRHPQHARGARS